VDPKDFWAANKGQWPHCDVCDMPAVLGTGEMQYLCGWHGIDLMVFEIAPGEVYLDPLEDVEWLTIGE
jgi:hypothetical protein